jgi:transposase-like protein
MAKAKVKTQPKQEMDLMKLFAQFATDEQCRIALEKLRFPDGVKCIRCQSEKISRAYKRNQFECESCGYHFSVTAGTIFHDSHLPLTKWFAAIYLMCEARKGVSANQLKRTIGVSYKTAWYLCHRIRAAVADADTTLLNGIVEVDETYIGGKAKNMHAKDRAEKIQGRGTVNKAMVLGAIQRGGGVRLITEKRADRATLHKFIKAAIDDATECVMTDTLPAYDGIADENTRHETVNHHLAEYVRGECHTNSVENVWSLFKRSIVGSYHQISEKHLDRYLDEFEFRFNNRNNPYLFRDTLLRLISADALRYDELTAEGQA